MTLRSKSQLNGIKHKGIPKTERPQRDKPKINAPKRQPLTDTDKLNIWKKIREDAHKEKKENWNIYDKFIFQAMSEMNRYLSKYPSYTSLDWLWIKAMLWTEGDADGHKYEWEHKPLRIGVPGDKAAPVVINRSEAVKLVIPSGSTWQSITSSNLIADPHMNIRAAIVYLMNRLSKSDIISVDDSNDKDPHTVMVSAIKGHSTFSDIVKDTNQIGTTMDILIRENPGVNPSKVHDGQELRYRKGSMQRAIIGWISPITANVIAKSYNGGGDSKYAEKLSYVYALFTSAAGNKNQ
ncbi:hypothetical protein FDW89_12090 [Citrobacter sp. wls830]|uniref:hypothetical protein n=1 Tax=Citrobacter sp. wls615 TaxID=2576435 RepID=UPI0010CA0353|nr:hypothetical protein [Citrobacter sp. wls615]TKU00174.1 hypothetical protein FDW89_12090 [Citrobacter sp. wls830]TKV14038.1 hypothetical protein FDX04_14310 [Citrobacter sp. wls615]